MSNSNNINCEWCGKPIQDKIHYYQNHKFCSIDCKYEDLDHYDVEDQRRDALSFKNDEKDDDYTYYRYYRD